jgi:hypothetical protein
MGVGRSAELLFENNREKEKKRKDHDEGSAERKRKILHRPQAAIG